MRKRKRRRTRIMLEKAWELLKVVAATGFAMMVGAACYHQYLVQNDLIGQREKIVFCYTVDWQQDEPEEIQQTPEPEPEEPERIDPEELRLLQICVEAEAGNQGLQGKRMVADVVLNRVADPDFPNTIREVITKPYHFSSYWDGGMSRIKEPSEETVRAVEMELEERGWPGLIYFTAGEWPEYGTPWKKVGDHYFSTK